MDLDNPTNPKKRRRPQTKGACSFCRARHLKCDSNEPCYQCERRGRDCVFDAVSQKRGPKPKYLTGASLPAVRNKSVPNEEDVHDSSIMSDTIKGVKPKKKLRKSLSDEDEDSSRTSDLDSPNITATDCISAVKQGLTTTLAFVETDNMSLPSNNWLLPQDFDTEGVVEIYKRSFSFVSQSLPTGLDISKTIQLITKRSSIILDQLQLVDVLVSCAVLAHGCIFASKGKHHSFRLAQYGLDILSLIFEMKAQPARLIYGLELLLHFFIGNNEPTKVHYLTLKALDVIEQNKTDVDPLTRHRIYSFAVGLPSHSHNPAYWAHKARSYNFRGDTAAECAGQVFLALMIAGNLDFITTYKFQGPMLKQYYINDFEPVLHFFDLTERTLHYFETTPSGQSDAGLRQLSGFRDILDGCRSFVLWKSGFVEEALTRAARLLIQGEGNVFGLPSLMAIVYACQVCQHLFQPFLLEKGLRTLDLESSAYPTIKRASIELRQPPSPRTIQSDLNYITRPCPTSSHVNTPVADTRIQSMEKAPQSWTYNHSVGYDPLLEPDYHSSPSIESTGTNISGLQDLSSYSELQPPSYRGPSNVYPTEVVGHPHGSDEEPHDVVPTGSIREVIELATRFTE